MTPQADGLDVGEERERFSALKRFARVRPAVERCGLCALPLGEDHQHLLERTSRQIECACDACAILFDRQDDGQYLRVPRRVRRLDDFGFTDLQWEQMMLPINLAFFLRNPEGEMVAMYPSPAGAIESALGLEEWDELVAGCRPLKRMEPEVEALLVNRVGEPVYFVVPIDECYRLVGLIRMKWRGLSGGTDVWGAVAGFLAELQRKAGGEMQVRHA
jgi:hypothetical protein